MKTDKNEYPAGWNEARVRAVIAHYDNQTDEERLAEIEKALAAERRKRVQKKTASNGAPLKQRSRPAGKRPSKVRRKT